MTDLTKLPPDELLSGLLGETHGIRGEREEICRRLERLEECEAALLKARMLLISEGDPDEDGEMIVEIDELLGEAARAVVEE